MMFLFGLWVCEPAGCIIADSTRQGNLEFWLAHLLRQGPACLDFHAFHNTVALLGVAFGIRSRCKLFIAISVELCDGHADGDNKGAQWQENATLAKCRWYSTYPVRSDSKRDPYGHKI